MRIVPELFDALWANVLAEAIYSLGLVALGFLVRFTIDWRRNHRFRQFWGQRSLADETAVLMVTGVYADTRPRGPNRYIKTFSSGQQMMLVGGDESGSQAEVRAASYLATEIGRYRRRGVVIDTDNRLQQRWDGTVVTLGSGASNEKTAVILGLPDNSFCRFEPGGIRALWDFRLFSVRLPAQQPAIDVGMLVKLPNPWFPGHTLVVCAGMNEQGTSGAAWYLARNWPQLLSRYRQRPFGVILETQWGSDQTSIPVAFSP